MYYRATWDLTFNTLTGRYNAFTCVDFKADGYTLGSPTEYGVWLSNFPVRGSTNLLQTYYGTHQIALN